MPRSSPGLFVTLLALCLGSYALGVLAGWLTEDVLWP